MRQASIALRKQKGMASQYPPLCCPQECASVVATTCHLIPNVWHRDYGVWKEQVVCPYEASKLSYACTLIQTPVWQAGKA